MSNTINFSVEISPENKDVALKSMALIAAMAEISMREMANCVEGIEVSDPEDTNITDVIVPGKEVKHYTKEEKEATEKPKKKSRSNKKSSKAEDKKEVQEEKKTETEEEKPVAKPKEEKAKEKKAKEESSEEVTIENVRTLLKEVVHNNRDAVVAKLKELGGKNVSTLPEENYGKMYEYLQSLK